MPSTSDYQYVASLKEPTKAERALFETWKQEHDALFGSSDKPGVLRQTEVDYLQYVDGLDSKAQNNRVVSEAQNQIGQADVSDLTPQQTTGFGTDRFLDKAIRKNLAGRNAIKGLSDFRTGQIENAISLGKGGGDMARQGMGQVAQNAASDAINNAGYQWQQSQNVADMVGYGLGLGGALAYDHYANPKQSDGSAAQ